tara:strand:+ start:272 stop:1207 length:936 start_codon:yes stop_codon:yes gene_type:complete
MQIREPRSYPVKGMEGLESTYSWHPGLPKNIILRVSKTSLGDFGFCAQQYFIKRVLGVKEEATDAMTRGSNVHDATEDFYNEVNVSYAASMRSYGLDRVKEYFSKFIPSSNPKRGEFELGEESHLQMLLDTEARRFMVSDPLHFLPVGNEITLDAVVEISGQLVHLTGIVDRMFMDENGDIHIHELKTGQWKDKPLKWETMRKEMAFYVYLLNQSKHPKLGGLNTTYWGWDHTGGEEIFRHIEAIKSGIVSKMKKDLEKLVRAHNGYTGRMLGTSFPLISDYRTDSTCNPWCRVKSFCPRFGGVSIPYEEE